MAIPIKNKVPKNIIETLSGAFKEYGIPLKIFSDNGTEFVARPVKEFLKQLGVVQWTSRNPGKAVSVERFNRTLKERLWVLMTDNNNFKYIDVLQDVLKGYNDSVHSSTGFAPSQVGDEEVIKILKGDRVEKEVTKQSALQAGDFLR